MVYDTEKSLQHQAIKKLESQGISTNDFYKWKLYHSEAFDKFIKQTEISLDIAIDRYKGSIKKHRYIVHTRG